MLMVSMKFCPFPFACSHLFLVLCVCLLCIPLSFACLLTHSRPKCSSFVFIFIFSISFSFCLFSISSSSLRFSFLLFLCLYQSHFSYCFQTESLFFHAILSFVTNYPCKIRIRMRNKNYQISSPKNGV